MSAVIVRYRDDPRLESCLDALRRQRGVALDVVIVENEAAARPPGSGESWKSAGGAVRRLEVLSRAANPGFAAAFNEACGRCGGDLVLSVNPDCRLDPDAVQAAARGLASDPQAGAVAFRLLRPGREVLDSAGIVMSALFLRARDRGRGRPAEGLHRTSDLVDAACLAGALFRRSALDAARDGAGDILDPRYFAYQEDVDLGWRLRRAGFAIRYEPDAVGEHERGWREGMRREVPVALRRMSLRNRWFTIAKNAPWIALSWRLPFLCAFELLLFLKLLVSEPRVVPAYAAAVAGVPGSIARRRLHDRSARRSRAR